MHLLNIWIISNNVYIEQVDSLLHKQNKEGKKREKNPKKQQRTTLFTFTNSHANYTVECLILIG